MTPRKYWPYVGVVIFVILTLINRSKRLPDASTDFSFREIKIFSWVNDGKNNDNQTVQATMELDMDDEEPVDTSVLRDIHLVMIGGTLMRYQYLSLVYRLRHGIWFDPFFSKFDLMNAETFESPFHGGTTAEFCYQTNKMLLPLEVCDCYSSAPGSNDTVENRYFYDPELNNSVVYLASDAPGRGEQTLQGRLLPNQVRNQPKGWQINSLKQAKEVLWRYNSWADGIVNYIRYLDPVPRHVVMSSTVGTSNVERLRYENSTNDSSVGNQEQRDSLLQAVINASEFQFVWQTVAFGSQDEKHGFERLATCDLPQINCLNVSFAEKEFYQDTMHAQEPAYRIANEQLLNLLGHLPNDYKMISPPRLSARSARQTKARQNHYPNAIIGYDKSMEASEADPSNALRNIHVALIGDSLTRYQYLSLAYRLRFGVWFNESQWHYNLVQQGSFESPFHILMWGEFLFHTNNVLYPYELCDCYRRPLDVVENHYYHDPYLNNSLVYISAMGHWKKRPHAMRGRVLPDQIHQERSNRSSFFKKGAFRERRDIVWGYADWADAILHHIRHLDPRPEYIVMNAGHWAHNFCNRPDGVNGTNWFSGNETLLSKETQSLLQAIKLMPEVQFVWKTTTSDKLGVLPTECDEMMCQLFPRCLNSSFTQRVRKEKYWDRVHFYEPVYQALNEVMLDNFGYLPDGYDRYNVTDILY